MCPRCRLSGGFERPGDTVEDGRDGEHDESRVLDETKQCDNCEL